MFSFLHMFYFGRTFFPPETEEVFTKEPQQRDMEKEKPPTKGTDEHSKEKMREKIAEAAEKRK